MTVAETSITCYYSTVVPKLAHSQNSRTMEVVQPGRDYSLSELMKLTNTHRSRKTGLPDIDKSSMSRVVNGLRAAGRLEPAPERKCSISGVKIIPSRLPTKEQSTPQQTTFPWSES